MSYQTLDTIADAYIPILLILFIMSLSHRLYTAWPLYKPAIVVLLFAISLLSASYGLMFIDNAMQIWPTLGLDYSTHTAVSLTLVYALSATYPRRWKIFFSTFIGYALLMVYQHYHTVVDILTAATTITAFAFVFYKVIFSKKTL